MSTTITETRSHDPITAENVMRLFPEINRTLIGTPRNASDASQDSELAGHDEEQIRLMEEVCIVIDENDVPIGSASKKICHLVKNIEQGLLHRAFSVFLFDSQNRLLLQQRASEKITFPDMWTNTCCSHPLGIPGETGVTLSESVEGVKRAAQRKLGHELGIKADEVPLYEFQFLARLHYKALQGSEDGIWGEHEIDYVLFIKPSKSISLDVNANEVRDAKYVSQQELKEMFKNPELKFTPWFKLICESMLYEWWDHLDNGLDKYLGEKDIRRML